MERGEEAENDTDDDEEEEEEDDDDNDDDELRTACISNSCSSIIVTVAAALIQGQLLTVQSESVGVCQTGSLFSMGVVVAESDRHCQCGLS
jgi:hypothetical protein